MKKNVLLGTLLLCSVTAISTFAQKDNVGIGTTKPDQSAVLDINSTNKGLLIPRMSLQQRSAIQAPAQGLMVYQSDFLSGFYFYDGTQWKPLASGNENNSVGETVDGDWSLTGNNITAVPTSFIGTTSNHPLLFKSNNKSIGFISVGSSGNVFFGDDSGLSAISNSAESGTNNVGIGNETLKLATKMFNPTTPTSYLGSYNLALGNYSLAGNTTGYQNVGLGYFTLVQNQSGYDNLGLGYKALFANTTGIGNTSVGAGTLSSNISGQYNVAIGYLAGRDAVGGSNLFLGYQAGLTEIGSNKLYISNNGSVNPLIKGDFSASTLKVNSKTTGFLAVGDFDAVAPMPTPVGYRLIVQDGILTEKVKVALRTSATDWADYVFAKDYKLMPLESVEQFTKVNNHLPNVPSADEMVKSGLDVAQTSKMFMEKIEELTLYMIEMNKEIKALKAENAKLKK